MLIYLIKDYLFKKLKSILSWSSPGTFLTAVLGSTRPWNLVLKEQFLQYQLTIPIYVQYQYIVFSTVNTKWMIRLWLLLLILELHTSLPFPSFVPVLKSPVTSEFLQREIIKSYLRIDMLTRKSFFKYLFLALIFLKLLLKAMSDLAL